MNMQIDHVLTCYRYMYAYEFYPLISIDDNKTVNYKCFILLFMYIIAHFDVFSIYFDDNKTINYKCILLLMNE